ncbi:MAG: hypothetical protein S4CHLAM37_00960 [Chlamydiia bacterium]|nr:hypothetical protein [Chlamydiia bacterium]
MDHTKFLKTAILFHVFFWINLNAATSINITGIPASLTITTAAAGADPTAVIDSSTSYDITTDLSSAKITGKIDTSMPSNTTLTTSLAAPSAGGTSSGAIALTTSEQNLVTGIPVGTHNTNTITYNFSATTAAGILNSTSRTVTYTLVDNG